MTEERWLHITKHHRELRKLCDGGSGSGAKTADDLQASRNTGSCSNHEISEPDCARVGTLPSRPLPGGVSGRWVYSDGLSNLKKAFAQEVRELAKTAVRMGVDPFRVITAALRKAKPRPRVSKLVSVDYDEEADVLYARLNHRKIVDTESLDPDGMVMASLDSKNHVVGLVIMHASAFS